MPVTYYELYDHNDVLFDVQPEERVTKSYREVAGVRFSTKTGKILKSAPTSYRWLYTDPLDGSTVGFDEKTAYIKEFDKSKLATIDRVGQALYADLFHGCETLDDMREVLQDAKLADAMIIGGTDGIVRDVRVTEISVEYLTIGYTTVETARMWVKRSIINPRLEAVEAQVRIDMAKEKRAELERELAVIDKELADALKERQ